MALNIANLAAKAMVGAGKAVSNLLRTYIIYEQTAGEYNPATGLIEGKTNTEYTFQAVRKEYSFQEFVGENSEAMSFSVMPGDFKLIAPSNLMPLVPVVGMQVYAGDEYMVIQSIRKDAVDAVYTLQMRPGKDVGD